MSVQLFISFHFFTQNHLVIHLLILFLHSIYPTNKTGVCLDLAYPDGHCALSPPQLQLWAAPAVVPGVVLHGCFSLSLTTATAGVSWALLLARIVVVTAAAAAAAAFDGRRVLLPRPGLGSREWSDGCVGTCHICWQQ